MKLKYVTHVLKCFVMWCVVGPMEEEGSDVSVLSNSQTFEGHRSKVSYSPHLCALGSELLRYAVQFQCGIKL